MLGFAILKIRLAALLAETAVKKSTDEITRNRTGSTFMHFAKVLGITKDQSFAYNGDVAVVVNNYETRVTHLPDDYVAGELAAAGQQAWFGFESLEPLAKLLKSKGLEEQMFDASLCETGGTDAAESEKLRLLAFNHKQSLPAKNEPAPDRLEVGKVIGNLRKIKQEAQTTFTVNIRDLSRICDYLKKVGDDLVELKIANDGKIMIFTSKTLEEKEPHVECYLKIKWGNLF